MDRPGSFHSTLALLADCFEILGGVPGKVLADRMGCLKGGMVANVVVPTEEHVRFAGRYKSVPASSWLTVPPGGRWRRADLALSGHRNRFDHSWRFFALPELSSAYQWCLPR